MLWKLTLTIRRDFFGVSRQVEGLGDDAAVGLPKEDMVESMWETEFEWVWLCAWDAWLGVEQVSSPSEEQEVPTLSAKEDGML